jgi:hypothetical protein
MMKYERLTHRNGNRIEEYCEVGHCKYADFRVCKFKGIEHNVDEDCIPAMIERLAELEDKIEQGKMVELPCKVGDTVYEVFKDHIPPFIKETEIEKIVITAKGLRLRLARNSFYETAVSSIGKTIFFTREEAEKRLKELQE